MPSKKIEVNGLQIRLESINDDDYVSLTDIARKFVHKSLKPANLIMNWLRNKNTIEFLGVWEQMNNPHFKVIEFDYFKEQAGLNRFAISSSLWIKNTNAIGLMTKAGRGGGTFAHKDIALGFCYWISPPFQLYILREFQRLQEEDFRRKDLKWHISKITDNIEEVRNLLDTIPHQDPQRNRVKDLTDGKED